MQKLIAVYRFDLPNALILKFPEREVLKFRTTQDDFDVEISIEVGTGEGKKRKHERYFTHARTSVAISVARPETQSPPPVTIDEHGKRNYIAQAPYFDERLPDYANVAAQILQRTLMFFRYRLRQPIAVDMAPFAEPLNNPTWTDESGQIAGKGTIHFILRPSPGIGPRQFGLRPFQRRNVSAFQRSLDRQVTPRLQDEFLAYAQSAAYEGNLRRAVVELAIACEIDVKFHVLGRSNVAESVFEYLEGRGTKMGVLDLISKVAKHAYGKCFKDDCPDDYRNIDYLFRCRNKIVHRGKTSFRDESGTTINLGDPMLQEWWASALVLVKWLRSL